MFHDICTNIRAHATSDISPTLYGAFWSLCIHGSGFSDKVLFYDFLALVVHRRLLSTALVHPASGSCVLWLFRMPFSKSWNLTTLGRCVNIRQRNVSSRLLFFVNIFSAFSRVQIFVDVFSRLERKLFIFDVLTRFLTSKKQCWCLHTPRSSSPSLLSLLTLQIKKNYVPSRMTKEERFVVKCCRNPSEKILLLECLNKFMHPLRL